MRTLGERAERPVAPGGYKESRRQRYNAVSQTGFHPGIILLADGSLGMPEEASPGFWLVQK